MMIIYAKKNILSNLINNLINWNNTTSNLWGQSNEKVLKLTKQNYKSYKLRLDAGCNSIYRNRNSKAAWFAKQHVKNVKK